MKIDTIKVVAENSLGYMVINERDLTKDHTVFKEKKTRKPRSKKIESPQD